MALGVSRGVRLDRNAVAGLQRVLIPAKAPQLGRPIRLHFPFHNIARLIRRLHVEVYVGVPEIKSRDGSLYANDSALVKGNRAMMTSDGMGC